MLTVLGGIGGRGARPYPHPHLRGAQPGAEARAADGPAPEIDGCAESRGPPPTGAGRDPGGTRPRYDVSRSTISQASPSEPKPTFPIGDRRERVQQVALAGPARAQRLELCRVAIPDAAPTLATISVGAALVILAP
jgi:hypothetical protein